MSGKNELAENMAKEKKRILAYWPCRDQLRQNVLVKQYYCDVDIAHLISYNEELAHKLTTEPAEIIPLVSFFLL